MEYINSSINILKARIREIDSDLQDSLKRIDNWKRDIELHIKYNESRMNIIKELEKSIELLKNNNGDE